MTLTIIGWVALTGLVPVAFYISIIISHSISVFFYGICIQNYIPLTQYSFRINGFADEALKYYAQVLFNEKYQCLNILVLFS